MSDASAQVTSELAPGGVMRVGFNFRNELLTGRDASGQPTGVALDLGRELARRLGARFEIVEYPDPGALAESAGADQWDVGFLGAEPARAKLIDFTAAYVEIEATYLVRSDSPLRAVADVDRPGLRVIAPGKAAYGLWLTENLKHAAFTGVDDATIAARRFAEEGFDALGGLKDRLVKDCARLPGTRVLDGQFAAVQQAVGVPRGRAAGLAYLKGFVEDAKAGGLVARLIAKHGVGHSLSVAPLVG
ncbi:MAG: transporter substrate-binding domain-containing protein [Pseudomonadota bacterium]|jgi:polar amino acid transport system substrate-binding protein